MIRSAGIIPFRENSEGTLEFFVGHPGGMARPYWAYMKGQVEEGEDVPHAAMREFAEESGLDVSWVSRENLIPLGTTLQNRNKVVTAYGLWWPDIDPKECFSNLVDNSTIPEIDRYAWMTLDALRGMTHSAHIRFYEDLTRMWEARSE